MPRGSIDQDRCATSCTARRWSHAAGAPAGGALGCPAFPPCAWAPCKVDPPGAASSAERSKDIAFVASDMWTAFRNVIRQRCDLVLHVLDRFHVMQLMSKAVGETRRLEVGQLRARGRAPVLTKTRWLLLKRPKNLRRSERNRLRELVNINLRTVRAYLLKEHFQHFWSYKDYGYAMRFLARWTTMATRAHDDADRREHRRRRE